MKKCEVLDNCLIAIGKGSIVYVSDRQYELARQKLKLIEVKKEEPKVEVKEEVKPTEEVKAVETAVQPKAKKTRKK